MSSLGPFLLLRRSGGRAVHVITGKRQEYVHLNITVTTGVSHVCPVRQFMKCLSQISCSVRVVVITVIMTPLYCHVRGHETVKPERAGGRT